MKKKLISTAMIMVLTLGTMLTGAISFATTASSQITLQSYKTALNSDAETLVIPKPEGVTSGAFMLAQITYEKGLDALPITAPTGWQTLLTTNAFTGGGDKDIGQALYYRIASANEPVSYTWTFVQKVKALGGIVRYSGVDPQTPVITSSGLGGYGVTTGQNQMTATSISGMAGAKLIALYGLKEMAFLEIPSGMQQVYQAWDRDNDYSILLAEQNLTASGATGDRISRSWEEALRTSPVESEWVAQLVALKPAGATIGTKTDGERLFDLGLLSGRGPGDLAENDFLTRSEMMVIFSRMMGQFNEAYAYRFPSPFNDGTGHWASSYVSYAHSKGWTSGIGNNMFGFEMRHTAQQAAVFMLKALGYQADVDFTWENAYQKAADLGLFQGVSIQPGSDILRGDLFKVMYKTLNTNSKGETITLGAKLGLF
jgi:hypothetical protein